MEDHREDIILENQLLNLTPLENQLLNLTPYMEEEGCQQTLLLWRINY